MADIFIDESKCDLCYKCKSVCPFEAIEEGKHGLEINAGCRMCRLCVQECPKQAIVLKQIGEPVPKDKWEGFLVFAEFFEGKLHPVTSELIGIGRKLARKVNMPVYCLLIGHRVGETPQKLLSYGVDEVFVYEDKRLEHVRVDVYANVFEDLIWEIRPSVVLVGSTPIGRSLAPRVAIRFNTGLTADCTTLKIKPNADLVQIRPAFGGNIMAEIITPNTRPQFATVRYKVMDNADVRVPFGVISKRAVTDRMISSGIEILNITKKPGVSSITEAKVLVVAGQGFKDKKDLSIVRETAALLGGEYAVTRPLVEKGWADHTRQIGLSGRTVKPELIITCGVSGAIQFTACMNAAGRIIAINTDRNAPIFKVSHIGIVGDIYKILPALIERIKGA